MDAGYALVGVSLAAYSLRVVLSSRAVVRRAEPLAPEAQRRGPEPRGSPPEHPGVGS